MALSVAAILPNYNGRSLLERFLPSVVAACRACDQVQEILVVDDASSDDSVAFLRARFPEVRVLELKENVGFARAVNRGVDAVAADIILLLNTDVQPEVGFLAPLLKVLEADDVFAAVPRVRRPEQGGVAESAIGAEFRRGLFRLKFLGDEPFEKHAEPFPTLYPVGAAAALRRSTFLELGGMDPLFRPYYWEDADLGYRAWKAGDRVLCVPESVVEHYSGTISATQDAGKVALAQGAYRFLFTWKNVHDPWWTASHWLWLGPHCLAALARGQASFVGELKAALARLPEALRARQAARRLACLSDAEVLRRAGG